MSGFEREKEVIETRLIARCNGQIDPLAPINEGEAIRGVVVTLFDDAKVDIACPRIAEDGSCMIRNAGTRDKQCVFAGIAGENKRAIRENTFRTILYGEDEGANNSASIANRLHVSPSTISHAVARLRDEGLVENGTPTVGDGKAGRPFIPLHVPENPRRILE